MLTPVKFAKELVQGLPQAELVILESGDHGFVVESAETVAQAMLNFLTKI
ncbi:MAG: alpha/beta hydrolase [Chroococcidiopsidaceae cyanobacterium CP_BM_RX_35]|nr:alpha/beta hydrolase [Chroococcidiopsidaceae cyanobacterium CP_BM_RX_35]